VAKLSADFEPLHFQPSTKAGAGQKCSINHFTHH